MCQIFGNWIAYGNYGDPVTGSGIRGIITPFVAFTRSYALSDVIGEETDHTIPYQYTIVYHADRVS